MSAHVTRLLPVLFLCSIAIVVLTISQVHTQGTGRITDGLVVLYTFEGGSGTTVTDVSGVGTPLNLTISDRN